MRFAAHVVSVVLNPLMMPTIGTACYFLLFPSVAQIYSADLIMRILIILACSTLFLPLVSVFMMMRIGKVSTVFIEEQRERSWPLVLTAAIYFVAYYFLLPSPPVPAFISVFILGAIVSMVVALFINMRWKISLHMIGIGGLCGGVTVLFHLAQEGNPLYLAMLFVSAGILGTARLLLNVHTPLQVLAGFLLGFVTEFALGILASS